MSESPLGLWYQVPILVWVFCYWCPIPK